MENPFNLDFKCLLQPINAENETGTDLRIEPPTDNLYYLIKDARTIARTIERQQLQKADLAKLKSSWQEVIEQAVKALSHHSKDLEMACWLAEALLREQGFAGLRDSFRLIRELVNAYWDNLYPAEDEDGILTKVAPLTGLNGLESDGTLIVPIAMVPLIQSRTHGSFALWQYQQAIEVSRITDPEKQAQRLASGAISIETLQAAAQECSPLFFKELLNNLTACKEEFSLLDKVLTEKCGMDAPPVSKIQAQLTACIDCVSTFSNEMLVVNESEEITIEVEHDLSVVESTVGFADEKQVAKESKQKKAIASRDDALQVLLQVAEYFRRTEPHSPLSYMLERTVRWGKLPLPLLLKELVKDSQALEQLRGLTGIEE